MTWPNEDMFAVTFDGKILMNARALDNIDLAKLVTKRTGIFVGVVLTKREVRELAERMYDASSEVAARFGTRRRGKKT